MLDEERAGEGRVDIAGRLRTHHAREPCARLRLADSAAHHARMRRQDPALEAVVPLDRLRRFVLRPTQHRRQPEIELRVGGRLGGGARCGRRTGRRRASGGGDGGGKVASLIKQSGARRDRGIYWPMAECRAGQCSASSSGGDVCGGERRKIRERRDRVERREVLHDRLMPRQARQRARTQPVGGESIHVDTFGHEPLDSLQVASDGGEMQGRAAVGGGGMQIGGRRGRGRVQQELEQRQRAAVRRIVHWPPPVVVLRKSHRTLAHA